MLITLHRYHNEMIPFLYSLLSCEHDEAGPDGRFLSLYKLDEQADDDLNTTLVYVPPAEKLVMRNLQSGRRLCRLPVKLLSTTHIDEDDNPFSYDVFAIKTANLAILLEWIRTDPDWHLDEADVEAWPRWAECWHPGRELSAGELDRWAWRQLRGAMAAMKENGGT